MLNLNGILLDDWPPPLYDAQRALYYGDCLFETIRFFEGEAPLLPQHWARLSGAMRTWQYEVPTGWSAAFFEEEIRRVAPPNARVRLSVWRSPGGWYAPLHSSPHFLIAAQPLDCGQYEWLEEGLSVGLCRTVRLPTDGLSGWKGPNSPRYVAAALEARDRGWQDALLLNAADRVCEATSSNVAWIEGQCLYTPPLSEGPVTGVLRGLLPLLTERAGLRYAEQQAPPERLLQAEELLLTNALRGIRWVRSCEGKAYACTQAARLHQALEEHISDMISAQKAVRRL